VVYKKLINDLCSALWGDVVPQIDIQLASNLDMRINAPTTSRWLSSSVPILRNRSRRPNSSMKGSHAGATGSQRVLAIVDRSLFLKSLLVEAR
jgi:hypothetical protein